MKKQTCITTTLAAAAECPQSRSAAVSQRPAAARTNEAGDVDLPGASPIAKLLRLIPPGAGRSRAPGAVSRCIFVSLLGLLTFSNQAAAQPAPPHQGTHPKPASEKAVAVTNTPSLEMRLAAEAQAAAAGKNWPEPIEDSMKHGFLLVDQLEYRMKDSADDTVRWDVQGWYGGDYNRLWMKTEGEWRTGGERVGEAEVQALYSRLIAPFWDFQAGLRYDQFSGPGFNRSRGFAVLGVQGLARYRFELEPALFISQDGDVSARLTATYDILLTQRLILQPRLDFDAAVQSAEKFGVGEGVNSVGWGLRLRYEIRREFAPYIGVHWLGRFGETADIARRDGGRADDLAVVFGVRLFF